MAEWTANQFPIKSGAVSGGKQPSISFDGLTVNNTTKAIIINPNSVPTADFQVNWDTGVGLFVQASDGFVGIGTDTKIISGSATATLGIGGQDSGFSVLELATNDNTDNAAIGLILFGNDGMTTNKLLASIRSTTAGTTTLNRGGELTFFTKPDGGTNDLQRMIITEAGNVGISVVPDEILHIGGNFKADNDGYFLNDVGVGTVSPGIEVGGANRVLTILGTVNPALELASSRSDADGATIGAIDFTWTTISFDDQRVAAIAIQSDGSVANDRGGKMLFLVRPDGGPTHVTKMTLRQNGDLNIDNLTASRMVTTDGSKNLASLAQSSAYTRNATIVEDRTLLASASATTINNNNVLAALIADLQSANILA